MAGDSAEEPRRFSLDHYSCQLLFLLCCYRGQCSPTREDFLPGKCGFILLPGVSLSMLAMLLLLPLGLQDIP